MTLCVLDIWMCIIFCIYPLFIVTLSLSRPFMNKLKDFDKQKSDLRQNVTCRKL